jgi:hypothetical protein
MFKLIESVLDSVIGVNQVKDFSDRPEVPPWKKPDRTQQEEREAKRDKEIARLRSKLW